MIHPLSRAIGLATQSIKPPGPSRRFDPVPNHDIYYLGFGVSIDVIELRHTLPRAQLRPGWVSVSGDPEETRSIPWFEGVNVVQDGLPFFSSSEELQHSTI